MIRPVAMSAFGIFQAILAQFPAQSQTFEVSTINPSPAATKGYSFKYVGLRQFTANNHTLRECVGFAYDVSPGLISGGPTWLDTERYDIAGVIPGDTRPPTSQLLLMFQALLADRLKLAVHHEQKEESVYNLVLGESEFKLKENTSHTEQGALLFKIRPSEAGTMVLPARNASMTGFASLLQRSALDRPVFDRTGSRDDTTLTSSGELTARNSIDGLSPLMPKPGIRKPAMPKPATNPISSPLFGNSA